MPATERVVLSNGSTIRDSCRVTGRPSILSAFISSVSLVRWRLPYQMAAGLWGRSQAQTTMDWGSLSGDKRIVLTYHLIISPKSSRETNTSFLFFIRRQKLFNFQVMSFSACDTSSHGEIIHPFPRGYKFSVSSLAHGQNCGWNRALSDWQKEVKPSSLLQRYRRKEELNCSFYTVDSQINEYTQMKWWSGLKIAEFLLCNYLLLKEKALVPAWRRSGNLSKKWEIWRQLSILWTEDHLQVVTTLIEQIWCIHIEIEFLTSQKNPEWPLVGIYP